MCSIRINKTIEDNLKELSKIGENKRNQIEKRLNQFAGVANKDVDGPFDKTSGNLKYVPEDLQHVRHYHIGRHRVYVSGSHKNCHYDAWMIKIFKRENELPEGSEKFQNILKQALEDKPVFDIGETGELTSFVTEMEEPSEVENTIEELHLTNHHPDNMIDTQVDNSPNQ